VEDVTAALNLLVDDEANLLRLYVRAYADGYEAGETAASGPSS
jgi:hypothetical protein